MFVQMTDLQRLENAVTELLSAHECVVIPNLGAFLLRSFPASANVFSGEIKPSGQTLFFNPAIISDDGLLHTHWRYKTGCDYATAQRAIQQLVESFSEKFKSNRSIALGKLGNFFLHSDGKLLFLPASPLNLSKDSFGLSPLSLRELFNSGSVSALITGSPAADKIDTAKVHEYGEAEVVELKINRQKSRGFIWKVAASICIISLSAAAVYFGKIDNNGKQRVQMASQIPPTVVEEKHAESNKKQAVFVSLLTPEDMNKGMENIKNGKGNVFICGSSYMSPLLAEIECNTWKKSGIPAVIGKKRGSSLIKVVIGRFESEKAASLYLEEIPVNSGFHAGLLITKLQFQ